MTFTVDRFVGCVLLVAALCVTPSRCDDFDIEILNFEVTAIEPAEYRVGMATQVTYNALLRNNGASQIDNNAVSLNTTFIFFSTDVHIIGHGQLDIRDPAWAPMTSVDVTGAVAEVTVTERACANQSVTHQLCAGVSLETGGIKCLDFKDISQGGAGKINCQAGESPSLAYLFALPAIFNLLLLALVVFLCRWVRRKRRRDREKMISAQESESDTFDRRRAYSVAHIYEDPVDRGEHGDSTDSGHYESRLAPYTLKGDEVVLHIAGIPAVDTTDQMEAIDSAGHVIGVVDENAPETVVGTDTEPAAVPTVVINITAVDSETAVESETAVDSSMEPEDLLEVHEDEILGQRFIIKRAESVDIPLHDAPDIPDPDADPGTGSHSEMNHDPNPDPSPALSTDPSLDLTPDPSPDLSPVLSPFSTPDPSPDTSPDLSPDPSPEPCPHPSRNLSPHPSQPDISLMIPEPVLEPRSSPSHDSSHDPYPGLGADPISDPAVDPSSDSICKPGSDSSSAKQLEVSTDPISDLNADLDADPHFEMGFDSNPVAIPDPLPEISADQLPSLNAEFSPDPVHEPRSDPFPAMSSDPPLEPSNNVMASVTMSDPDLEPSLDLSPVTIPTLHRQESIDPVPDVCPDLIPDPRSSDLNSDSSSEPRTDVRPDPKPDPISAFRADLNSNLVPVLSRNPGVDPVPDPGPDSCPEASLYISPDLAPDRKPDRIPDQHTDPEIEHLDPPFPFNSPPSYETSLAVNDPSPNPDPNPLYQRTIKPHPSLPPKPLPNPKQSLDPLQGQPTSRLVPNSTGSQPTLSRPTIKGFALESNKPKLDPKPTPNTDPGQAQDGAERPLRDKEASRSVERTSSTPASKPKPPSRSRNLSEPFGKNNTEKSKASRPDVPAKPKNYSQSDSANGEVKKPPLMAKPALLKVPDATQAPSVRFSLSVEEELYVDEPVVDRRSLIRRMSQPVQMHLEEVQKTLEQEGVYENIWNTSVEINRDRLVVDRTRTLGEGAFGRVYKAEAYSLKHRPGRSIVAVKELKDGADQSDKDEFLKELAIHALLKPHPHVVELLGCCIRDEPICIITEFVPGGSLQGYLRRTPAKQDLARHYFARFGLHVARGMAYIARMEIVHRDLAARNILISEHDAVCKVSDFGFARDVFGIECYPRAPEIAPIRWYSPEAILENIFSTKSDVWSFGVLLFEITTLGRVLPYRGRSNDQVMIQVASGSHPGRPPYCDKQIFDLMKKCWSRKAEDRPTFKQLVKDFEEIQSDYPDPSQVDQQLGLWLDVGDEESSF